MRRVNEAVRQVLSEALPELKDPRIGFVTVTGVETTSPTCGTPSVFVSVLGSERKQRDSWPAWTRPTACSRRGSRASSG